jgi:hypothetical protein
MPFSLGRMTLCVTCMVGELSQAFRAVFYSTADAIKPDIFLTVSEISDV